MFIEYYRICNSIFMRYPYEDIYNYLNLTVLHSVYSCWKQTCLGHASLTVPIADLTSGINGKNIVVAGLFNI